MAVCQRCGKKATLAYNRLFHLLPFRRREFCDDCFAGVQRREELFLIGSLFFVFFAIVGLIVLLHIQNSKRVEHNQAQIEVYYDVNDLNKDGWVDFWEERATETMRRNLTTYGYPWEQVLGEDDSGPRLHFMVQRGDILELAKIDGFFKRFNFTELMIDLFNKITDSKSKLQLLRVFVTFDKDIVFVLHRYDEIPDGGFTTDYFNPPGSLPKGTTPAPRLEPSEVHVCIESLSEAKIDAMMGLTDDIYHIENSTLVKGPGKKNKPRKINVITPG